MWRSAAADRRRTADEAGIATYAAARAVETTEASISAASLRAVSLEERSDMPELDRPRRPWALASKEMTSRS